MNTIRKQWRTKVPKLQNKNIDSVDFSELDATSTNNSRDQLKRFSNIYRKKR